MWLQAQGTANYIEWHFVDKAERNMAKYSSVISQNYLFVPFAFETMGPWNEESIRFFDELTKTTAEHDRMDSNDRMYEIFYILYECQIL